MKTERREVRMKPKTYQLRKAELDEGMSIRRTDGSRPAPVEVARVALGQAKVVEDPGA